MTIDRNQLSDYLDKIARFLIDSGSVKTDDMVQEEVPDCVVEAVTTLRADLAALNARVEELEHIAAERPKLDARILYLETLLSRCVERVEFAAECDADGANGDAELLRYIRAALKGAE